MQRAHVNKHSPHTHLKQIMDCFNSSASSSPSSAQSPRHQRPQPTYRCPYCLMEGLTEDGLHVHFPLYHVAQPNVPVIW